MTRIVGMNSTRLARRVAHADITVQKYKYKTNSYPQSALALLFVLAMLLLFVPAGMENMKKMRSWSKDNLISRILAHTLPMWVAGHTHDPHKGGTLGPRV